MSVSPGGTGSPSTSIIIAPIIKEGLLYKRGENIKTWRSRYFYLFADGSLRGFKTKPDNPFTTKPKNNFTVKDCQIMKLDRPMPYTFVIRGLEWTQAIERTFYADSEPDRQGWMDAIETVKSSLTGTAAAMLPPIAIMQAQSPSANISSEMENMDVDLDPAENPCNDQELYNKFFVQGNVPGMLSGKKKVTFENFEFLKLLGKGNFGKVILCREKTSRKLYAVKILRKKDVIKTKELNHTLTENRVLQTTNHPFLISLKCSFQTSDRLCFVTEYVNGGELFFHLSKDRFFSEDRTKFYGAEIISAIGYLHQNGIIHRDLKPENLLLDKDGHIKIADFGVCKEDIRNGITTRSICGTPEYLAPEVLGGTGYGRAVDWWSVGVVMYEMMIGRLPFYNRDQNTLFDLIIMQEVRLPESISVEARDLLRGLLRKNPLERLGGGPEDVKEVTQHVFFSCINWEDLVQRRIPPPFKPQVKSDIDTRYFDCAFTQQPVELTPPDNNEHLSSIPEANALNFEGFSYKDLSSTLGASLRSGTLSHS